ncbi:MAG: hypothetical protein HW421_3041 [Ignavibacteria bacterium]|nr:hypothetical protein [Ignavibacteria bacterium]
MKAILTDVTKCIGCSECVSACKVINHLPPDKPREWQKNDGLSARNWTSVLNNDKFNVRKQCRHCIEPACVTACPVGALNKSGIGAVVYDSNKCLGCRYCMMACPYGIPRYDWELAVPYIRKCILCYDNLKSGKITQPACTKGCPTGATIYGERNDLLNIARLRIKQEPDKYLDLIYGEKEVGGTNVLYITSKDCSLDFLFYYNNRIEKDVKLLGQPDFNEPYPQLSKFAMNSVPIAFVGMGAVMTGIYWVINRRKKIEKENKGIEDGED